MGRTVVTPPDGEPVSLDEARIQCEIDDLDADPVVDGMLQAFIATARAHVEDITDRAILKQTWRLSFDSFPDEIRLRGGYVDPEAKIGITFTDHEGVTQTLDQSRYQVDLSSKPPRIRPAWGCSWPATRNQMAAVQVTYEVGWPTAEKVPGPIRGAILMLVRDLYDGRSAKSPTNLGKNPTVGFLLFPYRLNVKP